MAAYERPDGWYSNFRVKDPLAPSGTRRVRLKLEGNLRSQREADAAERVLRVETEKEIAADTARRASSAASEAVRVDPERFSAYAGRWLADHVRVHRKPSTYRLYLVIVREWLMPYFGELRLDAITAERVDGYLPWATTHTVNRTFGTGAKARTRPGKPAAAKWLNETFACLSSLLSYAARLRHIPHNFCKGAAKLQAAAPDFDFYTAEECNHWLATCRIIEPRWYPFYLLGFRSGLRQGELFALRWANLELAQGRIKVRTSITRGAERDEAGEVRVANVETTPKSGKSRFVELAPDAGAVLSGIRHPGERVFQRADGTPLRRETLLHSWERITSASGLRDIGIHGMRHSFASQLVMLGAPLRHVQDQLGHSTIRMTERYAHLAPGSAKPWVALLGPPEAAS
ncbi:MAG: tyrosine-type recombinase/integrase [Myxococcota bacterium]